MPTCSFEASPSLSILKSRNVTVKYRGDFVKSPNFLLNLQTGRWELESDGSECTEEDFKKMDTDWQEWSHHTDVQYRDLRLKMYREQLSKQASSKDETESG